MSRDLSAAASILPPISGVNTYVIASSVTASRVRIPKEWMKDWLTIESDGCDTHFAMTTDITLAVARSGASTVNGTTYAVTAHGTGECVECPDSQQRHIDLSRLPQAPGDAFWYLAHVETAASAFVRIVRTSGQGSVA